MHRGRSSLSFAVVAAMLGALHAGQPALLAQNPFATQTVLEVNAQPLPENSGAAALATSLNKLRTWASVMMITAHPDDEDGGALTYMSRTEGARALLFTLTRGEGRPECDVRRGLRGAGADPDE